MNLWQAMEIYGNLYKSIDIFRNRGESINSNDI